jgi:hypothetical protein
VNVGQVKGYVNLCIVRKNVTVNNNIYEGDDMQGQEYVYICRVFVRHLFKKTLFS